MQDWLKKRLLRLLLVLLAITFLSFGMMRLAGSDVIEQKLENRGEAVSAEVAAAARAELGLDKPFLEQYAAWLGRTARGDLGKSYVSGRPVTELFCQRLPNTVLLTTLAVALTVAVSLPLGILAAMRQNGCVDYLVRGLSFLGSSLPNFLVALLLLYFLAVKMRLFPVIAEGAGLRSAVLPCLTLTIAMSAKYIRQVRAAVLEELSRPYIAGSLSRGMPLRTLLCKGVLRASGVTLLTLLLLSIGSLLGGTAIVETIFMWDGIGKMVTDAISMRDYPVIQAYVMLMALVYVLVNLLADISYRYLDPRVGKQLENE